MTVTAAIQASRRESRYAVRAGKTVPVRLLWTDEGEPVSVEGFLTDLSSRGVSVSLTVPPVLGKVVTLEVALPELEVELNLSGDAKWNQPTVDGRWRVGCDLDADLSADLVQRLSTAGYIERRQDDRTPIRVSGHVRWEGNTDETAVRLVDYSQGGFRFTSPELGHPGQRLVLRMKGESGEVSVQATCVWQGENGKGYAVGCHFLNRDGMAALREAVQWTQLRRRTLRRRGLQLSAWTLAGTFAVLIWSALQ